MKSRSKNTQRQWRRPHQQSVPIVSTASPTTASSSNSLATDTNATCADTADLMNPVETSSTVTTTAALQVNQMKNTNDEKRVKKFRRRGRWVQRRNNQFQELMQKRTDECVAKTFDDLNSGVLQLDILMKNARKSKLVKNRRKTMGNQFSPVIEAIAYHAHNMAQASLSRPKSTKQTPAVLQNNNTSSRATDSAVPDLSIIC